MELFIHNFFMTGIHNIAMTMEPPSSKTDKVVVEEMRSEFSSGNYHSAYQILKRNPMLHLNEEDMTIFLNNLDDIISTEENNKVYKIHNYTFHIVLHVVIYLF